jgi:hypothetical protein
MEVEPNPSVAPPLELELAKTTQKILLHVIATVR